MDSVDEWMHGVHDFLAFHSLHPWSPPDPFLTFVASKTILSFCVLFCSSWTDQRSAPLEASLSLESVPCSRIRILRSIFNGRPAFSLGSYCGSILSFNLPASCTWQRSEASKATRFLVKKLSLAHVSGS